MPALTYASRPKTKLGLISSAPLSRGRRIAIVVILVLSALITPPDVFTQVLLGGPLYVLYEISIIVVRLTNRPKAIED